MTYKPNIHYFPLAWVILLFLLLPRYIYCQDISVSPANLPPNKIPEHIVEMDQDENGYIWFANSTDGLVRYDGNNLKSFRPKRDISYSTNAFVRFECIEIDHSGNIWAGDFNEGLYAFNPELETFIHFKHDPADEFSISCDEIRVILEDRHGTLWIGTRLGVDTLDRQTGKFYKVTGITEVKERFGREHVREIFQDSNDDVWFGCGTPIDGDDLYPDLGGLYKFRKSDNELTLYQNIEGDTSSLINNKVGAIFEDSRGTFWIGTGGDGLHTMDRKNGKFTRYLSQANNPKKLSRPGYDPSNDNQHITFINEDADGYIWIGTDVGGLNRYNPISNSVQFYGPNEPEHYRIDRLDHWSSLRTRDGSLWISSSWISNSRLTKISRTLPKATFEQSGLFSISFAEDSEGMLWIGTNEGLVRRNEDGTHSTFKINPDVEFFENVIIYIEQGPPNTLIISSEGGLYSFDTKSEQFSRIEGSQDISTQVTFYDKENGSTWVGTEQGLYSLNLALGTHTNYLNEGMDSTELSNNSINAIIGDGPENIWISGYKGLFRFDKSKKKFETYFKKQMFNTVFIDSQNEIWASSNVGLKMYNRSADSFISYLDSTGVLDETTRVYGITEDNENNLWVHIDLGLIKINPVTKEAVLMNNIWNGPTPAIINRMLFTTGDGEILVGIESEGGYAHFNPNDFEEYSAEPKPFISKLFVNTDQLELGTSASDKQNQTKKVALNSEQNTFSVEFGNIDFQSADQSQSLTYMLQNHDKEFRPASSLRRAYYFDLDPGRYVFRVKASNIYGKTAETSMVIIIDPPWYMKTWAFVLYSLLFAAAIYAVHRMQKARTIRIERQRFQQKELEQAREIEKAYTELKSTQQQLIQSEKMASLGELTAGIAHEIQNPLNFVNNFSEVSKELIGEMNAELEKGDIEEAKEIAKDIDKNLDKINHHGQRASGIVKGMLEHSRTSDGKKEPTDINALADEYLRLSYHGLRAKDKSFNADFKTDFDQALPKVNVIPQDIGRVLLNLVNNAFYAVDKKATRHPEQSEESGAADNKSAKNNYRPEVVVSTRKFSNSIEISVKDNGPGIPPEIKDKIFQPFFTTKPTGQGTGLGLSLSYDIVKAHGGEIRILNIEGGGSEFIINIPTII